MIPQVEETMSKLPSLELVEPLAVADAVVDLETLVGRALARRVDQRRSEVDACHLRARAGGALRDRAGAAGEIEPALAGLWGQPLDDHLVNVRDRVGDVLVGPRAPHHALLLLELLERHQPSSIERWVNRLRAPQSSGKNRYLIRPPSSSTGVPWVPTTSSPITRATTR